MQFAIGGSLAGLLPGSDESVQADQLVNLLGLTGVPFVNVHNGCATAGSALAMARGADRVGRYDVGVVRRLRQARPRSLQRHPAQRSGLPHWYGELGFMVTTQFFAMKINRYMHDYGISREATLARVGGEELPQRRAATRTRGGASRSSEDEILGSRCSTTR